MQLENAELKEFKIRVYGILKNDSHFLVSHESYKGFHFTKFPGGGMEFGESTVDCLKREIKEELGIDIEIIKHLHTCESIIQNRFDLKQQVIGVYYLVKADRTALSRINTHLNKEILDGKVSLLKREWVAVNKLFSRLTFEMDKEAVLKIKGPV